MALSDTTVRQARITGNDYTIGDTDGLALNVTARGGKIWRFRYYWAGVQKRMSLGSYPQISLKEARARRDEARALEAQDINPYEHRKQQRRAVRFAAEHTLALNEIGYPKVWVDAQLSHADSDKVSAAYNHPEYVHRLRPADGNLLQRHALTQRSEPDVRRTQPTGQVRHQAEENAPGGDAGSLLLLHFLQQGREQDLPDGDL